MSKDVQASITIGGAVSNADYAELARLVAEECLSTDWCGETFEPGHRAVGEPLRLFADEASAERFDLLKAWCVTRALPFTLWFGSGDRDASRFVFTGTGELQTYPANDDDEVMVYEEKIRSLGSYEAVLAYFEAANFTIPPLVVEGEPDHALAS